MKKKNPKNDPPSEDLGDDYPIRSDHDGEERLHTGRLYSYPTLPGVLSELRYGDEPLASTKPAQSRNLSLRLNGDVHFLNARSEDRERELHTYIIDLNNKWSSLALKPEENVWDLFHKVCQKTGIPPKELRLLFGSRELYPIKTMILKDMNITNNSAFQIRLKLNGGSRAHWSLTPIRADRRHLFDDVNKRSDNTSHIQLIALL